MREWDIAMQGIRVSAENGVLTVQSDRPLEVLSSAVEHGGRCSTRCILNMTVPSGYQSDDPAHDIRAAAARCGASACVGMMTAADVTQAAVREEGDVLVVATAGASNAATPGEDAPVWGAGTVNIIVVVAHPMTDAALANALITVTEAKSRAFRMLDIRSTNSGAPATGTTTDSVAACTFPGPGEPYRYASTATDVGKRMGRAVSEAVYECLSLRNGNPPDRPLLTRLDERAPGTVAHFLSKDTSGITRADLDAAARHDARVRAALMALLASWDEPALADGDRARYVATVSRALFRREDSICEEECDTRDLAHQVLADIAYHLAGGR